jgi:hypothetical protein
MPAPPRNAPAWVALIPLAVVALVILRNSRARRLRIEAMWIAPTLIVALVGFDLYAQGQHTPTAFAIDAAGFGLGAALGWWRARFTHITVDQTTHDLTSRASPIGMLVILAVFALRFGIRAYVTQSGNALGPWATLIPDALLAMSVGLVFAGRVEIFLRASRLLNEARAGTSSVS